MKKALGFGGIAGLVFVSLSTLARAGAGADGKAVFLEQKCNLCHSVQSQGIEKKSEKMKGAELSNAGNTVKSADWLKNFLLQKELSDGAKHQKKYTGDEKQLDGLVHWIMSLKTS